MQSLVLVPGQLSTALLWRTQAEALADKADVMIADQNRADSIAGIAASVLDQAPDRFCLAAHGMSGFIAFEMVRRAPERILGLGLFDTLAPADTPAQTARRQRYLDLVAAGQFASVIEERIPTVVHPSRVGDKTITDLVRRMATETGAAAFARQTRAIMGRPDSRASLSAIRCPTLLVWGRQDGMATHDHQLEMLNGIAGAWLDILEDTGHFTTLERPRETTAALTALLARAA